MGLLDSRENENMQIAKQLLNMGIDIDQVCQITKITKEEAEKMLNSAP